jgi:uncharacterized protein
MTKELEKRGGIQAEIRADGSNVQVVGYASVFNQPAEIAGLFEETIVPGAFASAISRDDVPFLIEHSGLPLARTRSRTLKLSEDDHGLHIEASLDGDDPDVRRIVPKMKRGDLDKMSFSFRATKDEWDYDAEPPKRRVIEVELYDVSIVTVPAFEGTSIAMRSLEQSRKDAEAVLNDAEKRAADAAAARRRIAERKARQEQKIRGIRQDAT